MGTLSRTPFGRIDPHHFPCRSFCNSTLLQKKTRQKAGQGVGIASVSPAAKLLIFRVQNVLWGRGPYSLPETRRWVAAMGPNASAPKGQAQWFYSTFVCWLTARQPSFFLGSAQRLSRTHGYAWHSAEQSTGVVATVFMGTFSDILPGSATVASLS
jgi:hypothetical protein